MRQRLLFAQALMENPDILLLDESMNGLDASALQSARDWIRAERDKGKLIVIATHIEEDIASLCDQVFCVSDGSAVPVNAMSVK